MKKIKLFLGCFIAMTLLYACFDDEGNYDLSELATVGIQLSYTQPSIGEEYVIDPVIDYKGVDSTEFGYTWVCDIQDTWSDTICREKMLRYTFTEIANYRIRCRTRANRRINDSRYIRGKSFPLFFWMDDFVRAE